MIRDPESSLTITESAGQIKLKQAVDTTIQGRVLVLIQFDVCEEIRLDRLQQIFGARKLEHPSLKSRTGICSI